MPRLSAREVIASQKAHRREAAIRAMHRVARSDEEIAARLRRLGRQIREAALEKQETPDPARSEASTAPNQVRLTGGPLSAQYITSGQ